MSNTSRDVCDSGVQDIHVIVCIEEAGSGRGINDTRRCHQSSVSGWFAGRTPMVLPGINNSIHLARIAPEKIRGSEATEDGFA